MHPYAESISAICVAAAWCDGQITDLEKQTLDRIFIHLGFPRSEVMRRIGEAAEEGPSGEEIVVSEDQSLQKEYMRFALAVCLADGDLSKHKVDFLAKLANFLAISPGLLAELKSESEALLRPRDSEEIKGAPSRVEALLPPQRIVLGSETRREEPKSRDLKKETEIRKPLAEILFQGQDYGGEISLT